MAEIIKLAFGTDGDTTLSNRFGRAPRVVVVTVQDGAEVTRETREKAYNLSHQHHAYGDGEQDHDHGHEHHGSPADKFAAILDCQVLVTRSIGPHGAQYAVKHGLQLYAVSAKTVDEALSAYLAGTLAHEPRRVA